MKQAGMLFALTMLLVIIIPGLISFSYGTDAIYDISEPIAGANAEENEAGQYGQAAENDGIEVFGPSDVQYEQNGTKPVNEPLGDIGFEEYICGVVAAEMPAKYDAEALKAQAVAARTYAYRRLRKTGGSIETVSQADISGISQAYLSTDELRRIWGVGFDENYAKVEGAVNATRGEILVYDDEPIEAVFHSTSAGMTENAENVWQKEYPYLKSVPSGEDELISVKSFKNDELIGLMRDSFEGVELTDKSFLSQFQIISRTDAGYVLSVIVGNQTLTGMEIRNALGLKSSAFSVSGDGNDVIFTVKGYGHGVGMSQSGADFMAKNGYDYRQILSYYYSGASIASVN